MSMHLVDASPTDVQAAVRVFVAQQPRMLRIAHRILGSETEAEDVVQEAWVRWQRTDRRTVDDPAAFLATTAKRLAINTLQAARTRHESALTPWLEDFAAGVAERRPAAVEDPSSRVETTEAVERAWHLLLERLSPSERAGYVLRKGFDYSYHEIAGLLGVSTANARQLVSRAHRRLRSARRQPVGRQAQRRLTLAFATAARAGELAELESLLTADIPGPAAA